MTLFALFAFFGVPLTVFLVAWAAVVLDERADRPGGQGDGDGDPARARGTITGTGLPLAKKLGAA